MIVVAAVGLVAIAGFVLVGRGGKDGAAGRRLSVSAEAALNRYCALSDQLQALSIGSHAASSSGKFDGSPADFQRLLQLMGATLVEMEAKAPSQIRGDVTSTDMALRQAAAGSRAAVQSPSFAASALKISMYKTQHCPPAASANSGS